MGTDIILATVRADEEHPGEYPPGTDELVAFLDDGEELHWVMGWVFSREPLDCSSPSVDKAVNSLVECCEI